MTTKREKPNSFEPQRKSILDNLLENFKLANRVTYVHRLIYIGEHYFNVSSVKNINEVFESIIKRINDYCHDEKLTGYLLHYDHYFCHVIEVFQFVVVLNVVRDIGNRRARRIRWMNTWSWLFKKKMSIKILDGWSCCRLIITWIRWHFSKNLQFYVNRNDIYFHFCLYLVFPLGQFIFASLYFLCDFTCSESWTNGYLLRPNPQPCWKKLIQQPI